MLYSLLRLALQQFSRGVETKYSFLAWHTLKSIQSILRAGALRLLSLVELFSFTSSAREQVLRYRSFPQRFSHSTWINPCQEAVELTLFCRLHSLLDNFASAFALARRVSCWLPFSNSAVSCFDQLCTPVVLSSLRKKGNHSEKHFGNFTNKSCSYGATAERFNQNI